ncbi:MAG TPA: hypothetical protein VGV59_06840 [Pyrinomonadaceae bacterium]|nr:hypothetical protein [Pyrinomonadaceae bacterium]
MRSERTTRRLLTALLLCVASVASAAHADVQEGQMQQLVVPMQSGVFVSFTTETVPAGSQELSFSFIEAEFKPNLIHRLFVDEEQDFYFGYDLLVERAGAAGQYRVTVRPLSPDYERMLRARKAFLNRRPHPSLNPAASASQPQTVADGDTLAIDVLVNPRNGAKIVDVIKVTSDDPRLQEAPASTRPPRDFTLEDMQLKVTAYKLLVDGEAVYSSTSGCAGPLIWFALPGRGRFIFSLVPRPGYDFQKIGTVEHNKIKFSLGDERYEWVSRLPVVGNGGNWNLWVLHDPGYRSELFPAETTNARASRNQPDALTRSIDGARRTQKQPGFGAPSGTGATEAAPRRRTRVVIGAADGIEHLLPKQ